MAITIREAFVKASSFLQKEHTAELGQDPQRVARWMIEALLGLSASELLLRWDEYFPENNLSKLDEMLRRKVSGEPIQYILGEASFMDLELNVSPAVLIPRPETELLVEAVEKAVLNRFGAEVHIHIVDVGTGSGTIPVTLAVHQPNWSFTAIDLSPNALEVAKSNARKYGVEQRFDWMEGDLLEPFLKTNKTFDVLVSNPPYIPSGELAGLQREVQHEPMLALDGGDDGLDLYRRMMKQVASMKVKPSIIAFELGMGQDKAVAQLIRDELGWSDVQTIYDLQGIGRHVLAIHGQTL